MNIKHFRGSTEHCAAQIDRLLWSYHGEVLVYVTNDGCAAIPNNWPEARQVRSMYGPDIAGVFRRGVARDDIRDALIETRLEGYVIGNGRQRSQEERAYNTEYQRRRRVARKGARAAA